MYEEHIDNTKEANNAVTPEVQRALDIVYNTLMDIESKRTGINPRFIETMAYYRYAFRTALSREGIYADLHTDTSLVPFDVDPDDEDENIEEDAENDFNICFNPFIR